MPALVQSKKTVFTPPSGGGGTAANSISFDSPVTAGSLLVAFTFIGADSGNQSYASVVDNLGQTWTRAGTSQGSAVGCVVGIFYFLSTTGGSCTVTLTLNDRNDADVYTVAIAEYSGDAGVTPALIATNQGTANSQDPSPGSIAAGVGRVIVASYSHRKSNAGTQTVGSPFVQRQSDPDGLTHIGMGMADAVVSTGTQTPTFHFTASAGVWSAIGAAFAVGTAAPTPSPAPPPAPVLPPTPQPTPAVEPGPQSSQSGRIVTLVTVSQGNVYVAPASGSIWTAAINTTGTTLITSGVVRSSSLIQKLWFADGTHWLYYDPSDNTVKVWAATVGSLPADILSNTPRLIESWRGRIVLSGIIGDPQNWFMSAVSDPTDFDYFPTDQSPTQAVAGNNSALGMVGDVITGLCAYSDDVLIFFGDHTIWMCRGDPADGGNIDNVSQVVGGAWGICWARDPQGVVYFVSNQTGIFTLTPGQGPPVRISQQIEQLLTNINTGRNIIRCQWDDQQQGLHVYITPAATFGLTTHFFWEARTGGWWADTFANQAHSPLCCVTFDGNTPQDRRALIGSWDGYVRTTSKDAVTDDGTPIDTAVVLGPILTKEFDSVIFKDIQAILGADAGTVTYEVYVGSTAEIALASDPVASGTWTAGRSLTSPVRRSGHAIWIKLSAVSYWAMEAIKVRVHGQGKVSKRGY